MAAQPTVTLRSQRESRRLSALGQEKFTVRRPFTMRGRRFVRGDVVKVSDFPTVEKVVQMVNNRMLAVTQMAKMVAARPFTWRGQPFQPGDPFSLKGIRPEKRDQLLEHRYIQPQPVTVAA